MAGAFISYSHRDAGHFQQLNRFLQPLARNGSLTVWTDQQIQSGLNWRSEIDRALVQASAAVLLISQDFLNSEFISKTEIPYLLERHRRDGLMLLPVYLSPSNVKQLHPEITNIQGYGKPGETLLEKFTYGERERVFERLAQRLCELADITLSTPLHVDPVTRASQLEGRSHELTVALKREGAVLTTRYQLPGHEPFLTTERSWHAFEQAVRLILDLLRDGDIETLVRNAAYDRRNILFELLFDARYHEDIFRTAFHEPASAPQPNPVRARLRLRVATTDPDLLSLPWRLTTWNSRLLANEWLFISGPLDDPRKDTVTNAPSEVLLIGTTKNAQHLASLTSLLKETWPSKEESEEKGNLFLSVDTPQTVENTLSGQRPHLVYVHTPLKRQGGSLVLELASASLPLAQLLQHCNEQARPPALLYLNTHGVAPDVRAFAGSNIKLIAWRTLSHESDSAQTLAHDWLGSWLRSGLDPLVALHQIARQNPSSVETQTLGIYSSYRNWRTDVMARSAVAQPTHLRLDRQKQKSMVAAWLSDMAANDRVRVMALVPYSAPGNRLSDLPDQLRSHLEVQLHARVAIKFVRLQFPQSRGQLRQDLEAELPIQLRADDGEPLGNLLRRCGSSKDPILRPVLWLHWGTFGSDSEPSLSPKELNDWLDFTGYFLAQHCPLDLRLIASLCIELDPSKHGKLYKDLQKKNAEIHDDRYWLKILDPLDNVAQHELLDYLKEEGAGVPPQLRNELAFSLITETGGEFHALVRLLEEGKRHGYQALINKLRRHESASAVDDDPY